ncbi:MAG: DUF3343 domain-containing protein [Deltaproteobacteria bacterium]|nr:DUF3343 domain-containing protein [Deltaproteobacteria bacterium]MBF0524255.1 DUF3343 domain-containing protein [Deltaproteobacteria bacterium]
MSPTCVAILDSIHYILKAEKILKAREMPHEIVPVPREISSDCGMAILFDCALLMELRRVLSEMGIRIRGAYRSPGSARDGVPNGSRYVSLTDGDNELS